MSVIFVGCKDDNPDEPNGGNGQTTEIKVSLPASVDVVKGEPCKISAPNSPVLATDLIYLEKDGKIIACEVSEAAADYFAFKLPANFEAGSYKVSLKRGDRRVPLGSMTINIVSSMIQIEDGTTVYGVVESAEGPIEGVVVSDGVLTTTTDAKGVYQLKSAKELGYVFISVPSGYECALNGVFPDHYRELVTATSNVSTPENQSWMLTKVDQSNYKIVFLGDMHVANRTANNDIGQFKKVAADINKYMKSQSGKVYGITLGDMTWDLYWYDRNYGPADYHKTINEAMGGTPIYHTIGNHDNDMKAIGNWNAKKPFAFNVAPPYYSFNIGDVHFMMLDNVSCSRYNGVNPEERDQDAGVLYDPQWEWIKNDLQYVDKNTPIMVMMHVPVFKSTGVNTFATDMEDADKVIAAFEGYQLVHYVTGHTHRSYNIVPENSVTGGRNIYEHNLSAICSDWWWSGNMTPGLLQSTDGTPCGYGVWDITGTDIKWIYKCAGKDENFQFRAYDLNEIEFSLEKDVPLLTDSKMKNKFNTIIAAYNGSQKGKNEVLINAWQKNSRWKVEVKTKDGQALEVKEVSAYDPIQIMACTAKRMNSASCTSEPIGTAQNRHHFYKVVAPDADTDLIITVKDEFGHSWTETMERPKAFTFENYKINI